MKKALLLCTMLLCSALSFAFDGSGTQEDPYQIKTPEDLNEIRSNLSAYYTLMNDIDLKQWISENYPTPGWLPIGTESAPFKGYLNGNGYKISNLNINRPNVNNVGLFGYAISARIYNLNIQGNVTGNNYVSGLIGYSRVVSITNCSYEGAISGYSNVGGIIGYLSYSGPGTTNISNIRNCYVKSDITASKDYAGGIFGCDNSSHDQYNSYGYSTIMNCYFEGKIISSGDYVGGIAGKASGRYYYCMSRASLKGNDFVGGIVGYASGSSNSTTYLCYMYSCVNLCSTIISDGASCNRIYGGAYDSTIKLGTYNSSSINLSSDNTKVIRNSIIQEVTDGNANGYAMAEPGLKRAQTYKLIDWDMDEVWGIEENESFPYLRFINADIKIAPDGDETLIDFTKPDELTPAVSPSEEEDAGVNVTNTSFTSDDVAISFGLGERTQSYSARLWTNDNGTYSLRVYQNGTLTISTNSNNTLTNITFAGENVEGMVPDSGEMSKGSWTGEAQSVTFTIGQASNSIESIKVYFTHSTLLMSDAEPIVRKGTFDAGKVNYTRNTSGDYASFCMPFDVDLSLATGIDKVYIPLDQLLYNTETGWLMMFLKEQDMSSTISAGTPFLAKVNGEGVNLTNSASVTYRSALDANPAERTLYVFDYDGQSGVIYENTDMSVTWGGTYIPTEATEGLNSFNINGTFGQHTGTLNPFRAYVMQTKNQGAEVKGISANLEIGEATSIFDIFAKAKNEDKIFNLQGQKVKTMQSGHIYIVNGKKVVK